MFRPTALRSAFSGNTFRLVLSCLMYWPTLQWSQTVRDGSLIVAILSGSEFQYCIVLVKKGYL